MQKKNFIYVMLCICVAGLVSGCGNTDNNRKTTETPVPTKAVSATPMVTPGSNETEPSIVPSENTELTIYTLNSDSLEKKAVSALITLEDELTPEWILEQVVAAMEEEGFYIGINEIRILDDSVTIDFKSDAAPVIDVGASVEGVILEALAQSILDNLPQYKKIYISIEGKPYKTGHLEYELDEVYYFRR